MTGLIVGVNRAIAGRVFGVLRLGVRVLDGVVSRFAGAGEGERPPADLSSGGSRGERKDPGPGMALRLPGRDLEPERTELEDAFPDPTDRLVVFIHGLGETEEAWWLGTRADPEASPSAPRTFGAWLRDDLGFSPLYVRYDTGLHATENGRRLATLVEALCEEWPVEVDEVALVGHSMGGLVARSAVRHGADDDREWVRRTGHVVTLGAPGSGSCGDWLIGMGGSALRGALELLPFANLLLGGSGGASVPGTAYHLVADSSSDRRLLISVFDEAAGGDFHLLNDPRVYAHLRDWLALSFDE